MSSSLPPAWDRFLARRHGFEPGFLDRWLAPVYDHPGMLKAVLAPLPPDCPPDPETAPDTDRLVFAAMLTALRLRQGGACDPAEPSWPLVLLMATTPPEPGRAADGRPADDLTPALPVLLARTVLTCAPPARVCPAGMTG